MTKLAARLQAADKEKPYSWFVTESAQGRLKVSADEAYFEWLADCVKETLKVWPLY